MKIIGKFKIIDSFRLTGRGFVARGEILEGIVRVGSFTTIKINSDDIVLQIRGVEFIDNISTKESWVGLIFGYDNENQRTEFENIKLAEQLIDVFENKINRGNNIPGGIGNDEQRR